MQLNFSVKKVKDVFFFVAVQISSSKGYNLKAL